MNTTVTAERAARKLPLAGCDNGLVIQCVAMQDKPGKPVEWQTNVILKRLTRLHRGDAEVAEAGSGSRFSRSNPQTSRSAISAPPRGSSSSRRRCNLEKALQITSRRGGGRGGGKLAHVFRIKSEDVSLRDLRATARFLVKPSSM